MSRTTPVSAQARLILLLQIAFNKNSSWFQAFCVWKHVSQHRLAYLVLVLESQNPKMA